MTIPTPSRRPGYWTYRVEADLDTVALALIMADIAYDALAQAQTVRPGASVGREEQPLADDLDALATVVYAEAWTEDNRPEMPLDGEWIFEEERDWNAEWRKHIQPLRIGPILVVPPWLDEQTPGQDGDIRLIIDPGMAFGTGHHETTAHCIRALADLDLAGRRVADVGTGTGILAIIAAAKGATEVLAVDNDPVAIEVALPLIEDHRDRYGSGARVEATVGSAQDLINEGPFDVVIANMISPVLIELADQLAALLADDGVLVMSGISHLRIDDVHQAFAQVGVELTITPGEEWALAIGHKP